jgi:hypothetical protein
MLEGWAAFVPAMGNQTIICLTNALVSAIRWCPHTVILRVGGGITSDVSCLVTWKMMTAPIGDRASWVTVSYNTDGEV